METYLKWVQNGEKSKRNTNSILAHGKARKKEGKGPLTYLNLGQHTMGHGLGPIRGPCPKQRPNTSPRGEANLSPTQNPAEFLQEQSWVKWAP
jgi:hypothetical protein